MDHTDNNLKIVRLYLELAPKRRHKLSHAAALAALQRLERSLAHRP